MNKSIGAWAFIIGLVVAIIVAIVGAADVPAWTLILLAVLGLVVGFLNVTGQETNTFLIAAIAFLVTFQSLAGITVKLGTIGAMMSTFFGLMGVFIGPAAALVAIKALFAITKD